MPLHKHRSAPGVLLAFILATSCAWFAHAQEEESLHVGPLTLVSTTRHSRTQFDYTYRIQLVNSGGAWRNVAAYVTSASPHIVVLENEVLVGDVAAGATITPADTFVVRHDRTFPFNIAALNWRVESEPGNGAPDADAGADRTVRVDDEVTLDGSASTDPDGDSLTYRWQFRARPAGSTAALDDATSVTPRFNVDRAGTYLIDLVVNDGHADSSADTVQVSTINSSPVADAGPDRTVPRASLVTLDGSQSSDPDGDAMNFEWTLTQRPAGSAAQLTNANAPTPSLQLDKPGTYVARLVVNDSVLASGPDEVRISTENSVPVANAGANLTAFVSDTVVLDGSASTDADNDALSFFWTFASRPGGSGATLTSSDTPDARFIPDIAGLYVVQLIVNDGFGDSAPDTATVTVEVHVPPADTDGDGLTDAREAQLGTNPADADSDDDGLVDGREVDVTQTDPLDADSDDDTLTDGAEVDTHLTNPNAADTDGDGFRDDDEVRAGSDPRSPGSTPGGNPLPPDPATVAPPLPQGESPSIFSATEFLYTGQNAVQTGVAPGTIVPKRSAVVRGRVLNRASEPLPGVAITIHDHPELGRTVSRADGRFDLAVNGGGVLTVNYERAGHLSAQRQIELPWQDYVLAPDVVLIALDAQVTTIIANASTMQTARGSVSSDADGTRQSTLLVPAGTTAAMMLPDGTSQPLGSLKVRSTEYTVGPNGPATMPGPLPPASGYTYAVELSADEAIAAGATRVTFSQPLFHYVENFLDFPVGTIVPTGYYDRERVAWVPSDNGRVVRITAISNGMATVDTVGAGNLPAIVLSDDERRQLAQLYTVGQELWRAPIAHFTPWDCNYPFGPAADARAPQLGKLGDTDPDDDCEENGSIIECLSQTLGEVLPITGTRQYLRYSSSRVAGRTAAHTLDIPLSGAEPLPESLTRIVLDVSIAGRSSFHSFAPATNLTHRFTWDGKDVYGRTVHGGALATIRVGYVYRAVYHEPANFEQSFARFSGIPMSSNRARQEFTIWHADQKMIGVTVAAPIGGWSLSSHHAYAAAARVLFLGDGQRRTAGGTSTASIRTIAGTTSHPLGGVPEEMWQFHNLVNLIGAPDGSLYFINVGRVWRLDAELTLTHVAGAATAGFSGDGGPAVDATFREPTALAMAPDGSLYIADSRNHRIRRIGPDGIITTVAGSGATSSGGFLGTFSGDGGPATQAGLNFPTGVAVAPDGSLYIADSENRRIRRVDPQGMITTDAGTGASGSAGDGGRAALATFILPRTVNVGPDGSVYVIDNRRLVRRMTPDGIISRFAGGGRFPFENGHHATDVTIEGAAAPQIEANLGFGPDGSVYLSSEGTHTIGRIAPDGMLTIVAGGPPKVHHGEPFSNDGGPATRSTLGVNLSGPVVAPDGALYYFEQAGTARLGRIHRIAPTLPGQAFGEFVVPSSDGSVLYAFNASGRHLRTMDGLTQATRLEFAYDTQDRLISVTDADGGVTRIERAGNGAPTAIVAPGGQRTALALDGNGYLARATNPAGESVQLSYTGGGLLETKRDAKGQVHRFSYDDLGRLVRDEDPAGGETTLSRVETENGYEVTRSTALGRIASYRVEQLPSGEIRRVNSDRVGARTIVSTAPDGTVTSTSPDGTVTTLTPSPDPRFGMLVSLPTITHRAPSGRTLTQTLQRTVSPSSLDDPLSVQEQLDTLVVNGRRFTRRYDATSRTITNQTPEGRETVIALDSQGRSVSKRLAPSLDPITAAFDEHGNLREVGQGEHTQTFTYDSGRRVVSRTNAEDEQTLFEYDAADRVQQLTSPGGGVYRFGYDANGNREELQLPGGALHRFTYTPIDLRATHALPGSGVYRRDYNVDRALGIFRLPSGREVQTKFDASGRHGGFTYPEASTSFDYRPGDATDRAERITRTPATIGSAQQLQFTFDGALPITIAWSGAAQGTYAYSYDNNFLLTSSRLVSGSDDVQTNFARDLEGLITGYGPFSLTRNGPAGALSGISDGTLASSFAYDTMGRQISRSMSVGATSVYAGAFSYDRAGRIIQKAETVGGVAHNFAYAYDADGRLVEVSRGGAVIEQYAYDANGNRLNASHDAQDRLLQSGGVSYEFDVDGFLTRRGSDTFVYSARGELLRATVGSQVATYSYDGIARRVARTTAAGTTQYLYGEPGNIFVVTAVRGVDGVLTTLYYDDAGLLFAMQRGSARFYVATDQVGTPRRVTDANGQVVKALEFDSFGKLISDSNPSFDLPIGYAGGLADPLSGLVRFGFRDYDPASGRWTARDPAGFAAGQGNLFAYVGNDPINRRDPTGLVCVGLSGYAGVGAGLEICCDWDGDCSICGEVGVGIGGGFEAGSGDVSETGLKALAEGSAQCGPIGGKVGASIDDDGCVETELKAILGGVEIGKDGVTVSAGGDDDDTSFRCALEAKAVVEGCVEL